MPPDAGAWESKGEKKIGSFMTACRKAGKTDFLQLKTESFGYGIEKVYSIF